MTHITLHVLAYWDIWWDTSLDPRQVTCIGLLSDL